MRTKINWPRGFSHIGCKFMEKQTRQSPQGLKPNISFASFAARLKSCPDTKHKFSRVYAQIIFAGAILLSAGIGAQQTAPSAQDPAHELAQKVDLHYNQLRSLKAGFSESYEGLGMRRTESGTLLMMKPGRMKWEYSEPAGKLFLLDGTFAWFYTQGDSQVQRILAKQLNDLRSPLRFLLGRTKLEKELSNLTLRPASNGQFALTGQPIGQEKRVARLTLTVTGDGTITGIEMEEADGALTRFTFTGEQPNVTFPAGTFRFTPPKGVPVVDALPPV